MAHPRRDFHSTQAAAAGRAFPDDGVARAGRRRLPALRQSALAVALAFLPGAGGALAANCTWNTTTGNWAGPGNWLACLSGVGTPFGTPGAADSATIGIAGIVTINTAQQVRTLSNAGTINIDAFLLTLVGGGSTTNTGTINVGGPSVASLQVAAGHNVNNTGGTISIGNGSAVNQFGSSITGGTIGTTGTGALVVFSSTSNVLNGVTLNGRMDMASNAGSRQRVIGGLTLNGSVDVGAGILSIDNALNGGSQSVLGNGTINLVDAASRLAMEGTGITTLGTGIVVRGQGNVGQPALAAGNQTLLNNGRISADIGGATLALTTPANGGSSELRNAGVLDARNGGILNLSGVRVDNTGGLVNAQDGSVVLHSGGRITGGTIGSAGSGVFRASSSNVNVLDGVTVSGVMDISTVGSARERVVGGVNLAGGTVNIGNNGILSIDNGISGAAQTIAGNGTIVLQDASARLAFEGAFSTTIGSGIVIRGQGIVGQAAFAAGNHTVFNNGLISADVSGGTLALALPANGGSSSYQNNGILEAINGGRLLLQSAVTGNAGSQIRAGAGSVVEQAGVVISGLVNTTGSGRFSANSNGANFLSNATLNGALDMESIANARQRITGGGLVLNGSIAIASGAILSIDNASAGVAQSVTGTGTINLNGATARLAFEGSSPTTIGTGIVIRGQGNVGQAAISAGNQQVTVGGRISADVAGGTLALTLPASGGSSSYLNNGVLEAVNGGRLLLQAAVVGNPGSELRALAGSVIEQSGVTVSGTINTTGSGLFAANASGANFLAGVTLNGTLDMASIANARERVIGNLVLNGAVNVGSGSILSIDNATSGGSQTVSGNGTINLVSADSRLALEGGATTTLGTGIVVRGQGNVGQAAFSAGNQTLVNNGRISADIDGATLSITTPASGGASVFRNAALVDARNGGTLQLLNVTVDNTGGLVNAQAGSVVLHTGGRISGGTIGSAGGGVFRATSNGANFLDGVTVAGVVDMATLPGTRERVVGGLTLAGGQFNLANGAVLSIDNAMNGGPQTLGGNGTINLGENTTLAFEGSHGSTIGAGVLVRGQGRIGPAAFSAGNQQLLNLGTIRGDGGTLTIGLPASGGGSTFVNNGLVQADNGSVVLQLAVNGTGVLRVDGTGQMNLANAANSAGTLVHNGSNPGSLNVGTQPLTISADYQNANFGIGNAFNRRANVAGTGAINAAPGVVQTVTGNTVSNGTSATPTLAITNVRVGAPTTFDFQVGNSGTGPALRGAVQTTVNGGNLTDGQLGFTATDFGPGSTQTVTFTAAGAGAISIAPNQRLAIVNNFDNTQSQNQLLNIVAGPGAAAYNAAQGSVGIDPVTVVVANQRILGNNSTALTVSNVAPTGAFTEVLNASFGTATGNATNNIASITGGLGAGGVVAGASDASTMRVGVNTSAEGVRTGTQVVNFQSNGTGTSGLGTIGVGSQTVNVQGNVYKVASGQLDTPALNFGVIQVGQSVSPVNLSFTNAAIGQAGFVEDLKVVFGSITGANAGFVSTNGGQMTGILSGQSSTAANGTMTVSVNTSTAGVVNAQVGLNYITQGTVNGVSNGLGEAGVGSGSFGVSGTINALVVNQAAPQINNPAITIAARVGDSLASTQRAVSVTNVAGAPPQAGLNATLSTASNPPITASGSFNLLGAGATNNTSLVVGLASTAAAQSFSGATASVSFVSDATNQGCLVNCTVDQGSQQVSVNGRVYTPAVASVAPSVNFGIVRVGDVVGTRGVSVANSAAVTALNDTLSASIGGTGGVFTNNGGSVDGLVAGGAANTTALRVGLNTANAGVFNGTATVAAVSRNPDMADLSLGNTVVSLTGQVNNLAQAAFQKTSGAGTFTQTAANAFTLDFGDIAQGSSGILTARLAAWNRAPAGQPSDDLKGSYTGADDTVALSFSGFNAFAQLGTNQTGPELLVNLFNTASTGLFTQTITLTGLSFNADDLLGIGTNATLFVRANVIDPGTSVIPLPPAGWLLLGGLAVMGWMGRRRSA